MEYKSKVAFIYVKTLTSADTWYQVLTPDQAKGIRGYKIKSRYVYGQQSQQPFDYAFNSAPTAGDTTTGNGFWSNAGGGAGDEAGPVSGIWARSVIAGTVIEVMTFA